MFFLCLIKPQQKHYCENKSEVLDTHLDINSFIHHRFVAPGLRNYVAIRHPR